MSKIDESAPFQPCNIAILTVSDTRTEDDDSSGKTLFERASNAGHQVIARRILPDDVDQIATQLKEWIAHPAVDVIISTGGTGITARDVTPEAFATVVEKELPGFGELFRWLSYQSIGAAAIESRATGGVANGTYLFALPGSTGACRDGWDGILEAELDSRRGPCNLVKLKPRLARR